MLTRQKTILCLLAAAKRPVSRIELTKWSFVVREETPSRGGGSFYDFLPYKQGPFSFCLYREIEGLIHQGYVVAPDETLWHSTPLANAPVASLPSAVKKDAAFVVERFAGQQVNDVVDYVYDRYPRFTVNSERRKLAPRKIAPVAVYTAGYEQLSIDAFLDRLIENGIQRIVDVRNNPIARRYGFHKSTLSRLAERVRIEYVHLPELGIESSLRRDLKTPDDYDALFLQYEQDTIAQEDDAVELVARLVKEEASVLVCMEANPRFCHRTRLASAVAVKTGLPIKDLGAGYR
jgi:uncharacterized protein (DUF488 family)